MSVIDDLTSAGGQVADQAGRTAGQAVAGVQGAADAASRAAAEAQRVAAGVADEARAAVDAGLATVRQGASEVQAGIAAGRATIDDAVGRGRALLGQAQSVIGEIMAIPTMARAVVKDTMGLIEDVVDTLFVQPVEWLQKNARDSWAEKVTAEWRRGWDGWTELLAVYDIAAARGNAAATIPYADRVPPACLVMDIGPVVQLVGRQEAARLYVWPTLQGPDYAIRPWYFTTPQVASRDIPCPRVVPRPGEIWQPLWAMRNAVVVPEAGYASGRELMRWLDYTALAAVARRVDPMRLAWPSTGWGELRDHDWLAQPVAREVLAQPLTEDGSAPDETRPGLTRADYARLAAMASVNLATGALIYDSPLDRATRRAASARELLTAALSRALTAQTLGAARRVEVAARTAFDASGRYVPLAPPSGVRLDPALATLVATPAGARALELARQVATGQTSMQGPAVRQALADPVVGPLLRRALG